MGEGGLATGGNGARDLDLIPNMKISAVMQSQLIYRRVWLVGLTTRARRVGAMWWCLSCAYGADLLPALSRRRRFTCDEAGSNSSANHTGHIRAIDNNGVHHVPPRDGPWTGQLPQ